MAIRHQDSPKPTSRLTQLRVHLHALWDRLTAPHPSLTLESDRSKARMLAAIHIPMPFIVLAIFLLRGYSISSFGSAAGLMTIGVIVALTITYLLSRTPHYKAGVTWIIGVLIILIVGILFVDGSEAVLHTMPLYFAHALILASLFLNIGMTIAIAFTTLACVVVLALRIPDASVHLLVNELSYLATLYVLILVSTIVRTFYERKLVHTSETARESEGRYRTLFEATFEPILIHDNGVIIAVNPALERLIGFTAAELKGSHILNFISADDRQRLKDERPEGEAHYEVVIIARDGRAFAAQVLTKPIQVHGRWMRMLSIRDLTAQRTAEAERLDLAVTRDRQVVLQKLIRNLSHDFRTPLAVIKTSLYLLERLTSDPARHQKHLDVVRIQTQRLQEMMDDFITLARLDQVRRSDMSTASIDIDRVLRAVVDEHEALAQKRNVALHYHGQSMGGIIDGEALQRIAKSLISNGLLYTPAGGRVDVHTRIDDQTLVVTIQDTGVGIVEDDLPHLYEPFFRGDPTRSTETGGAGLGLTIAHKLVHVMGGSIGVVSQVGVGSTFTILLPLLSSEGDLCEDPVAPLSEPLP